MNNVLSISSKEIIHHLKMSCQIPQAVEEIAVQRIIIDTANSAGITVTEEELQQEGDRLRFAKKLVKASDTWAWLKTHHLNLDEFEELVHNKVLSQKVAHHLFADKVESFFYQNRLDFITAATYQVILDDYDLALELFYAIQEDEITFPQIAREYIPDSQLRRAGGYRGIQRRTDFRPEVAAAVFAATAPEIIKPIITSKSVYLIWVEEIIQPELTQELQEEIIAILFDAWLQQQVQQMEILTSLDSDIEKQALADSLMQA